MIDLTAQNLNFDKKTITVTAGDQVTINFNNQDAGIQNNFAVYQDQTAQNPIFVGNDITGPSTTTYTFAAPDQPGAYFFRSDNHPDMNGDFIVQ
jgi:plastocyanin